jgi:exonuclease VII small subunit
MMKQEWSHSEYFEELCALAASGQISEPEFVELRDHMQHCAHCRSTLGDFTDLLHTKLPLLDPELMGSSKLAGLLSENSSYRERFLTRARKQGLAVSCGPLDPTLGSRWGSWLLPGRGYAPVAALAIVLLVATVAILGYNLRESNARHNALAADMIAMHRQIAQQNRAERSPAPEGRFGSPSSSESAPAPIDTATSETDPELVRARQDYATAAARANALQEQLQSTAFELQAARAQFEEANDFRMQLANQLAEAEQAMTRVSEKLPGLRQSRSEDAETIAAQGLQIQQLSEKVSAQTEDLDRERSLLAAGRDIHDLMGARNLHIVDVLDVDSKGKDGRAFGRVFYTEEKSLIFYAFDLGDRGTAKRTASFQVWGARGPAQSPAQSLGIFYVDDQNQNRWVLKFEDPRILAEIDSVFVTVEPPGGSPKPTGRKFLYAYLKADPNHP